MFLIYYIYKIGYMYYVIPYILVEIYANVCCNEYLDTY